MVGISTLLWASASLLLSVSQTQALSTDVSLEPLLALVQPKLAVRQSLDPNDIPEKCKSVCTGILSTISNCADAKCACTNKNAQDLNSCVSCVVSLSPNDDTVVKAGQEVNDQFTQLCKSENTPVDSQQVDKDGKPNGASGSGVNGAIWIAGVSAGLLAVMA